MKKELWGNTHKITPWKEYLRTESILDVPLPRREPDDLSKHGIREDESKKIGFAEGRLANGYPFRLECAVYEHSKILSVFVSKMGLIGVNEEDIDNYLRQQDIYEIYGTQPEIYTYIDKKGNEFWRLDTLLESEGDIYASSPISIEEFSYGHMAQEFRILLKENTAIFKAYYNEDGDIAEYAVCIVKENLFKVKFDCYILSLLEKEKLTTILSMGKDQKDIIKLLQDYFALQAPESFFALMDEYRISYNIREEF